MSDYACSLSSSSLFQAIQREVLEHLKDLEHINLQYRKLAREGRTDHSGVLKHMMTDCNTRWDKLQQQVSGMMQRLKESASVKEDYVSNRDMLYNWLTEMDVQVTDIEHLSSMDIPTKLAEIRVGHVKECLWHRRPYCRSTFFYRPHASICHHIYN